MSRLFLTAAAGFLSVLVGCGGGGDNNGPTGSTRPAASIDLTLSGTGPIAAIGETRTITAVVRDADNAVIAGAPVSYSSSNGSVASVSNTGTVTAAGNGSATITATSGSASETIEVTVAQQLSAVSLTLTPVAMGTVTQLQPQARDSRGVAIASVNQFTFASSNSTVAVVSPTGLLTAIAPGTATITVGATHVNTTLNATPALTVTLPAVNAAPASITATPASQFEPPTVTVAPGSTVNFVFQSLSHNVNFDVGNAPANIPTTTSATVSRVFPNAGSFPYHCNLHSGMTGTVNVAHTSFIALLSGASERPTPSGSAATGAAVFIRNGNSIDYVITFQGLTGIPVGAHIHGPADANGTADILVTFNTSAATGGTGVLTGSLTAAAVQGMTLDQLVALMENGTAYVNLHTAQHQSGEIRGQIGRP